MSYMATFLRGAIIGLLVAFICHYAKHEPHKPDTFQCPHCGTKLQWTDDKLWRGYIECRSGWTAATPNQVTPNDEFECCIVLTNWVLNTCDSIDNMPMYSVDNNGGLAL